MNQLGAVLAQCLSSGAVFTSLCAALVVPPLAWLGVRALAPVISAMHDDRGWQAGVAAFAASLPGGLFLILVGLGIAEGAKSPCLQLTAGKVLYGVLATLIAAAIARSVLQAYQRHRELRAMLADAKAVQGRAAQIAQEVGIPLFEVQDDRQMLIMVANAPRAGAYISTMSLRQFEDVELRAALFHERAHLERGDHRLTPWLYFLTDLLPLPVPDLIGVYRCSREFCADSCALSHVKRTDLASALLRVARGTSPDTLRAVAAFAERDAMYGRLDVLLRPKSAPSPNRRRRTFVVVALSLIVAVATAVPAITATLVHCQSLRLLS